MTTAAEVAVESVRWSFAPGAQLWLSDDALRLDRHLKAGRASVVKHGGHRTVYRVAIGDQVVYWKVCRLYGPRAWWRDFLRGPKARLEFDRARELSTRGIATVEPLAWGRMGGFWPPASHLITRALEGTTPLDDYLLDHPPRMPVDRRRLTVALAEFIARLHDAGVTHPDLHPGNLLVREEPEGYRFFLIDVHDVQLGRPLDRSARRANLVLLNRWFQIRATRSDRLRFWRTYAGSNDPPEDARLIESESERSVLSLWESRDSRCLRPNRHFQKVTGRGVSGFAVRDFPPEVLSELIRDPDDPFARKEAQILKDSRSATVCTLTLPGQPVPAVYKRFRVTELTDPVANLVRSSGALRSWKSGHALLDRQIPSPRPLLVLYRRRLGFPTVGYLLCEAVQPSRHLQEVIGSGSEAEKRKLIETLARWIRLMHDRVVSHRDLKAANILVTPGGNCSFIDLVGVRTRRTVARRVRVRDLARLNASFVASPDVNRGDRLRFLRVYLLWGLRGSAGWKEWWKEVDRATQEKVRRNALRNRPLS